MSKLEENLAKAQAMHRFTGPIDKVINSLPAEVKYHQAKETLRRAVNEILDAALKGEAS